MPPDQGAESVDDPILPQHYICVDGIRWVKPYHFDYVCHVKERWIGKTLIDVFSKEFAARPRSYYEAACEDGRLRVEGSANPNAPLRQGQCMRHFLHRHEPPALDVPIPVLGVTADIIAVGKPASLPVHAAGQYRKNTLASVLQALRPDLGALLPVHRLDKAVSGVTLFARSPAAANALRLQIQGREVDKVYVARVLGRFQAASLTVDVPLMWDPRENHVTTVPCAQPGSAGLVSPQRGAPAGIAQPIQRGSGASTTGSSPPSSSERLQGARGVVAPDAGCTAEPLVAADGGAAVQRGEWLRSGLQPAGGQSRVGACAAASLKAVNVPEATLPCNEQSQYENSHCPIAGTAACHDGGASQNGDSAIQGQSRGAGAKRQQRQQQYRAKQAKRAGREQASSLGEGCAQPRDALTNFRLLIHAPDGRTSLVECRPRTGRTHQIRVHLQHLGHPIANDAKYGGTYPGPRQPRTFLSDAAPPSQAEGPLPKRHRACPHTPLNVGVADGVDDREGPRFGALERAAAGAEALAPSDDEGATAGATGVAAGAASAQAAWQGAWANGPGAGRSGQVDLPAGSNALIIGDGAEARKSSAAGAQAALLCPEEMRDPVCVHCPRLCPAGSEGELLPLWLHARDYSCAAWAFHCPVPRWADPAWVPPDPGGSAGTCSG